MSGLAQFAPFHGSATTRNFAHGRAPPRSPLRTAWKRSQRSCSRRRCDLGVYPGGHVGGACDPWSVTLSLGTLPVDPPVVLAPMAGITNVAFRQLCREQGAGIYVCEMITTIALVHRNPKTDHMIQFGPEEQPRSMQLYGVDPDMTARAVR